MSSSLGVVGLLLLPSFSAVQAGRSFEETLRSSDAVFFGRVDQVAVVAGAKPRSSRFGGVRDIRLARVVVERRVMGPMQDTVWVLADPMGARLGDSLARGDRAFFTSEYDGSVRVVYAPATVLEVEEVTADGILFSNWAGSMHVQKEGGVFVLDQEWAESDLLRESMIEKGGVEGDAMTIAERDLHNVVACYFNEALPTLSVSIASSGGGWSAYVRGDGAWRCGMATGTLSEEERARLSSAIDGLRLFQPRSDLGSQRKPGEGFLCMRICTEKGASTIRVFKNGASSDEARFKDMQRLWRLLPGGGKPKLW